MKTDPRCSHTGNCARCPLARCAGAGTADSSPGKSALAPAVATHALAALRSRLQLSPIAGVALAGRLA
jgi:hypothetical protein